MRYRILDYQNGKIISDIKTTDGVCIMLKAVFSYSNSFDVVTHNQEFVTCDFVQRNGEWFHEACNRSADFQDN